MLIALIAAVVAAVAGKLRGGSLESLATTAFRSPLLLWVGLIVQITFDLWDPPWLGPLGGLLVLLFTNVLVGAFLAANFRLPGMVLAAIGMLMNVIVIALNGAMPVSLDAAAAAGIRLGDVGIKHEILDAGTRLPWLADVIPVPFLHVLLSPGDVVLAAGIAWLVYRRTTADRSEPEGASGRPASG